jgi:hypothetical protein
VNKKIKDKWVKALRSGKYKQGKGYLRADEGDGECYCCLGVLANECLDGKWGSYHEGLDDNKSKLIWIYSYWHHAAGEGGTRMLPECLTLDLDVKVDNWLGVLSHMNDEGYTFEQIADWIEKNL